MQDIAAGAAGAAATVAAEDIHTPAVVDRYGQAVVYRMAVHTAAADTNTAAAHNLPAGVDAYNHTLGLVPETHNAAVAADMPARYYTMYQTLPWTCVYFLFF